jgi:hypothetical protein
LPAIHNWSSDPLRINNGVLVAQDFTYSSDNNPDWMTVSALQDWMEINQNHIGKI